MGRKGWRSVVALVSTALLLISAPTATAGQTRIGINGARPSELPGIAGVLDGAGMTQQGWLTHANRVGANWLPGMTVVPLDYPAQLGPLWGVGALTGDQSIAIGQQNLHALIMAELANGNTVSVAGGSMGTLVIDREIAYLESLSAPPPAGAITFYIFGGESRGFGKTYAPGVTLPIIGVTLDPVPETRYDTVVVYSQWDGWANPPDRPWNLLAVLNAVMGVFLQVDGSNDHSKVTGASIEDAVLVSQVTNGLGGTTSTYMVPTTDLPLTRPLRLLGVPKPLVDGLNSWLIHLIAQGYSSMTPGVTHVEDGRLVWGRSAPELVSAPAGITSDENSEAPAGERIFSSAVQADDLVEDDASQPLPVEVVIAGVDDAEPSAAGETEEIVDDDAADGEGVGGSSIGSQPSEDNTTSVEEPREEAEDDIKDDTKDDDTKNDIKDDIKGADTKDDEPKEAGSREDKGPDGGSATPGRESDRPDRSSPQDAPAAA